MPKKKRADGAGTTRQLASGRWQARHRGPDGVLRPAPVTFDTRLDADAWLRRQAGDVELGLWSPPEQREAAPRQTLAQYAETWLATRDLKPRTRHEYRALLDALIVPALGDAQLDRIGPATVRTWHAAMRAEVGTARETARKAAELARRRAADKRLSADERRSAEAEAQRQERAASLTRETRLAHAYSLLRSIFATAVADDLRADNPCRIRGAGKARKQHTTAVASLAELEVIVAAMPPRYRAMVLLAAWCGLRFGELAELRRRDVDLESGVVRVSRGVTRTAGAVHVGDPKSEAGRRPVSIPPHLLVALADHLEQHVDAGHDALLFPARGGQHLVPSSLYRVWYPAREAAGRPDLRFHDLRHTGATLAAATGATLKELMARLGHSTPQAALVYQHAAADRDRAIAEALSGMAGGTVIPLRARRAAGA